MIAQFMTKCLNPLKRVNSILTLFIDTERCVLKYEESLNPLKRVNSILTVIEEMCY